jgi:DNA-directed RNA polymerase sigma subunit (sigma70/sigma32)
MKEAELVEEVITVLYWRCAIDGHRHTSRRIALKCLNAEELVAKWKLRRAEIKRRNIEMVARRKSGATYENLGKHFGLSKQRVRQIVDRAICLERYKAAKEEERLEQKAATAGAR